MSTIPEPIPYPARRRYRWASPDRVMSYTDAVRFFTAMRRQQPEADNPQRWATLETMVEALHVLQHDGVDEMPGPKLHKLLIKCAQRCGWVTDLNKLQRTMRVTPSATDPSLLHCWSCGRDLPRHAFMTPMTMSQKLRYGKPPESRSRVMAKRCANCRDNAKESKRRKTVRVAVSKQRKAYVRLTEQRLARGGDVYRAHLIDIRAHKDSTRRALLKANCVGTRRAFYEAKRDLLALSAQRLEQLLEDNAVDQLNVERVSWLGLVTPDERKALFTLYTEAIHDEHRVGRMPVFETPLEVKRKPLN